MTPGSRKIVLIGGAKSGKTALMNFIKTGRFDPNYIATIGMELHSIDNFAGDVTFKFWDTAGDHKFRGLADGYYFGADLAIVFYPTDDMAVVNFSMRYEREFKRVCPNVPVITIISRCDLKNHQVVSKIDPNISIHDPQSIDALLVKMCETLGLEINRETIQNGTLVNPSLINSYNHQSCSYETKLDSHQADFDSYQNADEYDDESEQIKNLLVLNLSGNKIYEALDTITMDYGLNVINVTKDMLSMTLEELIALSYR